MDSNDDRLHLSRLRENIALIEMHGGVSLGDSSSNLEESVVLRVKPGKESADI